MEYTVDGAINYARSYRQENMAADALRILADAVLELRGENTAYRKMISVTTEPVVGKIEQVANRLDLMLAQLEDREDEVAQARWAARWEAMSPEERLVEIELMDQHVAEAEKEARDD